MTRTARVARTAFDLKHVNRLRVPEFWIVSLNLVAGAKSSKSHLPADAPAPKAADKGADSFHFVPEKETIRIAYELDDRFAMIQTLKLELFRRFKEPALWTLDLAKLGPQALVHGQHTLKWDGRVTKDATAEQAGTESATGVEQDLTALAIDKTIHADFPDGYITIQHSPYKLRITATDGAAKPITVTAWTYFHVLVKKLELELGPVEAVPTAGLTAARTALDKTVYDAVKATGLPAANAASPTKVFLPSNIYKIAGAEMNDNTAFAEYQKMWDAGPRIPVIAKVRLLASDDTEVKCEDGPGAKALGKVKFLWDWEDPDENVAGQGSPAAPTAFIQAAIDYYKNGTDATRAADNHTYPEGDNCHKDRDGKRGPGATRIFPTGPGYASQKAALDENIFPFQVEECGVRKWAAYSYAWTAGKMIGRTGILFQPSRMAGDNYKVAVYLAYETKWDAVKSLESIVLDVTDKTLKPPAAIKAGSGPFQIWREIHISRYIRKKNTIAEFVTANLAGIQGYFHQPYIEILDKTKVADRFELPSAGYNTAAKDALATSADAFLPLAVDAAADHSSTASSFLVRTYAAFVAHVNATFNTVANPNGGANWLVANGIANQTDYVNKFTNVVSAGGCVVMETLVDKLHTLTAPTVANDGITIMQFNHVTSEQGAAVAANGGALPAGMGALNGEAVDVTGATRNKCCFALWNPRLDTFVHEIGHHMFLPHSRTAPGEQVLRHDSDDDACVMRYRRPAVTAFCGICQLRMRGWNPGPNSAAAILKNVAAQNRKA